MMSSNKALMKTVFVLMLILCTYSHAQLISINLSSNDNHPQYAINKTPVTESDMEVVLKKLQSLAPGTRIMIRTQEKTPATDLAGLLLTIREIGLTNVAISVPAFRKGQQGRITIAADISPRPISDVLGYDGGFQTNIIEYGSDVPAVRYGKSSTNGDIPIILKK